MPASQFDGSRPNGHFGEGRGDISLPPLGFTACQLVARASQRTCHPTSPTTVECCRPRRPRIAEPADQLVPQSSS